MAALGGTSNGADDPKDSGLAQGAPQGRWRVWTAEATLELHMTRCHRGDSAGSSVEPHVPCECPA